MKNLTLTIAVFEPREDGDEAEVTCQVTEEELRQLEQSGVYFLPLSAVKALKPYWDKGWLASDCFSLNGALYASLD